MTMACMHHHEYIPPALSLPSPLSPGSTDADTATTPPAAALASLIPSKPFLTTPTPVLLGDNLPGDNATDRLASAARTPLVPTRPPTATAVAPGRETQEARGVFDGETPPLNMGLRFGELKEPDPVWAEPVVPGLLREPVRDFDPGVVDERPLPEPGDRGGAPVLPPFVLGDGVRPALTPPVLMAGESEPPAVEDLDLALAAPKPLAEPPPLLLTAVASPPPCLVLLTAVLFLRGAVVVEAFGVPVGD